MTDIHANRRRVPLQHSGMSVARYPLACEGLEKLQTSLGFLNKPFPEVETRKVGDKRRPLGIQQTSGTSINIARGLQEVDLDTAITAIWEGVPDLSKAMSVTFTRADVQWRRGGEGYAVMIPDSYAQGKLRSQRVKVAHVLKELGTGSTLDRDFDLDRNVDMTVAYIPRRARPDTGPATLALLQTIEPITIEFGPARPFFHDGMGVPSRIRIQAPIQT